MELEGEKKRVKKHSPFLRRVFTIFLERRETPHSIQTRIDTHTNRLFQVRKSRPLAASNEKKKARDDASRRRPRRLSSSSRVSRGPLRRQERRGRGEKKSFFVFCFFSPFSYFLCLPGGKKYDDARRRPKKSKKVKEERALYHQSHEDRDGRPRRERKDPKGGKVKEAPTEGVAKTKSAVVSLESERREDRKKSGPTTKKVLSLGRLFDCFVGTLLSS